VRFSCLTDGPYVPGLFLRPFRSSPCPSNHFRLVSKNKKKIPARFQILLLASSKCMSSCACSYGMDFSTLSQDTSMSACTCPWPQICLWVRHGLELLKQGIIWRVHSGTKIRIWRDNWLPRGNHKIVGKANKMRLRWLSDLIDEGTKTWKEDTVRSLFFPHEVLQIPIPSRVDSVLTWVPTHPLLKFYSRHINPFLVCFPSRTRDSGVQKWFQNFDLNFFSSKSTQI
jgi:hypothetical protein